MLPHPLRGAFLVALPILLGVVGCWCGVLVPPPVTERAYPLPHHVPKYPGNLTLRFAMVHDVIHERFPRHGLAYYRARNREVEKVLESKKRPTARGEEADEYFRLLDDWGVGLEFLGQHQQAVDLMRDKLKQQEALGYEGRDLYSTYANLGTFLILWQLSEGVKDAPRAKERIGESVRWVRKAIEVYPQSHFGREAWQLVLEEFLLAALDDPQLLLRFDMVGNRLDQAVDPGSAACFDEKRWLEPGDFPGSSLAAKAALYLQRSKPTAEVTPQLEAILSEMRRCIQRVGAEEGWMQEANTSHDEPVPFDEPALGIVGMWRMGAGANPHFALALGEIMLRVGQRYIAWTAYERAHQLSGHYWPDPQIQERLAEHCRARQRLIEASLPEEDWAGVRRRFENELAFGQRYQRDSQDYEARRLEEGAATTDPHFYDAFEADREPIATPVGDEDRTFARVTVTHMFPEPSEVLPWSLLFAGALAFTGACAGALLVKVLPPRRWVPDR